MTQTNPQLATLIGLLNAPRRSAVCPGAGTPPGAGGGG
ncbi:MAG: hypothetical protein AVDCRST_MAG30-3492 [uncultured Solirubrobacteraceae bacterium]|uniref:Uncharacterized protein n=1 Tax=uncultured Solirubrobacteraceae bacterium TaxID=1162706 RepID=A0A6J4TN30_9ACTN|nr:MAG: hypothetical protein AVDCRST_MAG30-3492 [uncultured Solirubrobacteraceae bacterium]